MQHLPPFIAPSEHHDADSALAQIQHIYASFVQTILLTSTKWYSKLFLIFLL